MTTLVLGGAGFVGLNIAQALVEAGEAVVLFDRAAAPDAFLETLPAGANVRMVEGDVTDPCAVEAAVEGVDAIVHGAAITAGPEREASDPEAILAVNLNSVVSVLRAGRAAGVRRIVILSSGAAYGDAAFGTDPLTEADSPVDPTALYGLTKFASERVAARLGTLWSVDVRTVRLSSVFGPWERRTGVRDTLSPHFQVMERFTLGEAAVLDRPGRRDWVYAPDVGRAVAALVVARAPRYPLYHISTGVRWTVLAWAQRMAAAFPGATVHLAQPGEAATIDLHAARDRAAMAIDRMRDDLVAPRFADLASSVEHYADWWARHGTEMVG